MEKVVRSIIIGRSTSPIKARLELSKAFKIKALNFIATPFKDSFNKVDFGITFKDNHVSTSTLDISVSTHFIEICRALLWVLPSEGSPSSPKPI